MALSNGICPNAGCANGASRIQIERYEGPGEYCPECGETLHPVPPAAAPRAPFNGLSALEALQQFETEEPAAGAAPATPRPRRMRRLTIATGAIVAAAVGSIAILHVSAVGHPASGEAIHVCRTSMTERFADDVVREYAAKSGTPVTRFELSRSDQCDVRFATSSTLAAADAVAHDGIVAIVNPANPVTHLDAATVRAIFRGEITDWSQAGGRPGPIVTMLPEEGSDEAQTLAKGLLRGARPSERVKRFASSSETARAVVRADSRGAIGLVAFSEAVPGKVLALGDAAPNPLSIGDRRYPLSLNVVVLTDGNAPAPAAALAQYARSEQAQASAVRNGLVPRKGL